MAFEAIENMPRSRKIALIVLGGIIIIGGYFYFIFFPLRGEITVLKNTISNLNREITINEIKLRKLDRLKVENRALQRKLEILQAQLPEEEEVSGLLKQISDLSLESGLEILLWKPGERIRNPSGMYMEIPVDVEVSGGYHALATFFDKISKLPRIVNISNLMMDGAKVVGERVLIRSRFTATTFAITREGEKQQKK